MCGIDCDPFTTYFTTIDDEFVVKDMYSPALFLERFHTAGLNTFSAEAGNRSYALANSWCQPLPSITGVVDVAGLNH
jgi:hypothetical protein